jgi:hypothetical protein
MWKICVFTFGLLACISLALPLSAAPQFGRQRGSRGQDEVCFYKDIQYQGVEECFRLGDSASTLQSMNRQPSSIRIYGGASVTVYDDTNFRGHSTVFTSSVPDLGQVRLDNKSWNDRIRSFQINSRNGSYGSSGPYGNGPYGNAPVYGGPQSRYPEQQQLSEGVCVYDHPNYQGRSQCWSGNETLSDLRRQGNWSDRISSIRVFGRSEAVVYRETGLRGASFVVTRDIPNLAQISGSGSRSWDHQISSMQIENGRGNRNQGGTWGRSRRY